MVIFRSIRIQIILAFLVITVFTGLVVSFINYRESKIFLENQLERELQNTANLVEKNIEDKLFEAGNLVLTISIKPEFRRLDKEKIQVTIENFLAFADVFFNVYVYDEKGELISAAYFDKRPYKPYLGENFNNYNNVFSNCAGKVILDGKPVFTDTFYSKGDRIILAYIAPVMGEDDKEIKGIISCAIYVQDKKLENLLIKLKPSYNGFIYLMDQSGNNLAYAGHIPSHIEDLKIEDLLNNKGFFKLNQETFSYKLNRVDIANIYVLVAVPNSLALTLLENYTKNMILYTVFSLVVAIFISIFFANRLVSPISMLVEGLREVGKGNYSFRVNLRSTGEIDKAIGAFNEMVEKLQKNRIIEKLWIENWNR